MILQKMPLKINSSKYIIKALLLTCFLSFNFVSAQEIIEDKKPQVLEKAKDSVLNQSRIKADGVASVVGDFIILESDLDREIAQLKAQGADLGDMTRCELFGSLLEGKLYAHQAIKDSELVNELYIKSLVEQQIQVILGKTKLDMAGLLKFYNKD